MLHERSCGEHRPLLRWRCGRRCPKLISKLISGPKNDLAWTLHPVGARGFAQTEAESVVGAL